MNPTMMTIMMIIRMSLNWLIIMLPLFKWWVRVVLNHKTHAQKQR